MITSETGKASVSTFEKVQKEEEKKITRGCRQ